jgi:hypothetical protein
MYITLPNKFKLSLALLIAISGAAVAAPQSVEAFDKTTWNTLVNDSARPSIVVFSSVTCTHCPGAINKIAARLAAAKSHTQLLIVSMDSEDDEALLHDPHYASAARLFAFNGSAQALQYGVNPGWRGMTPYIAYLDGKRGVNFVAGEPKEALLRAWSAAGR